MKIGTLIIYVICNPKSAKSITILSTSLHHPLFLVSEKYDFVVKRFGYIEASLKWVVTLKEFWNNDNIYLILKEVLNSQFTNWKVDITLTIYEKGV